MPAFQPVSSSYSLSIFISYAFPIIGTSFIFLTFSYPSLNSFVVFSFCAADVQEIPAGLGDHVVDCVRRGAPVHRLRDSAHANRRVHKPRHHDQRGGRSFWPVSADYGSQFPTTPPE